MPDVTLGTLNPTFTTTTFSGDDAADTFGWDVVYLTSVNVINQTIADYFKSGEFDAAFAFDETVPPQDGFNAFNMKGEFGPWQITTGGGGNLVNLKIPFISGTAGFVGNKDIIELSGGWVNVQVTLGWHPVPDKLTPGSVSAELKIVTSGNAPAAGSAGDIAGAASATSAGAISGASPTTVSVLDVTIPSLSQDSLAGGAVETVAKQWLQNNLGIFDYVFLSADVAETAASGQWSWIKPTYVGYAYTDVLNADGTLDINNSLFGIMSLTEGRVPGSKNADESIVSPQLQISAGGMPSNSGVNAALLLDQSLVVEKIIYPNLPQLFEGADQSNFSWSGQTVTNSDALTLQLEMDPQWYVGPNNPCTATIPAAALSVTFNQTNVQQTFSNITFPYGIQDEVNVTLSLTSTSTVGVNEAGQFMMQYASDTVSTISAAPDPVKTALESLEGLGVNLIMTALCCVDGLGAAAADAGAGSDIASQATGDPLTQISPATNPTVEINPAAGETGPSVNADPAAEGGSDASNLSPEQESVADEIQNSVSGGESASGTVEIPHANRQEIGPEDANSPIANEAGEEIRQPNPMKFKDFVPRFTFKVWAMFVGMFAGELYSEMGNLDILGAYGQDPTKMPTLHNFLDNCIDNAVWTNTGDQQLVCAGLNGPFIMGFTLANQSPTAAAG